MMLTIVIYPLRKRYPWLHRLGSNALWLRIHMGLGIVGPIAILYHAKYGFAAANSGVALATMLAVTISGIIGWFIYRHVHIGLALRKREVAELLAEVVRTRTILDADGDAGIRAELQSLAAAVSHAPNSLLPATGRYLLIDLKTRTAGLWLRPAIRRGLAQSLAARKWSPDELRQHQHDAEIHLSGFLRAIRQAAGLGWYERLFAIWHFFHVPLFFFLIITATIHVIAVHKY
jgi:hypothetical protein